MQNVEEWRLQTGEVLVREGEPAENFFVLLEGEVSVAKKYGDQQVVVARYGPAHSSAKCRCCSTFLTF